jgi:hypothetical protein
VHSTPVDADCTQIPPSVGLLSHSRSSRQASLALATGAQTAHVTALAAGRHSSSARETSSPPTLSRGASFAGAWEAPTRSALRRDRPVEPARQRQLFTRLQRTVETTGTSPNATSIIGQPERAMTGRLDGCPSARSFIRPAWSRAAGRVSRRRPRACRLAAPSRPREAEPRRRGGTRAARRARHRLRQARQPGG